MTITIKLDTGNAAFEGDRDEEVLRILTHWLTTNMRFTGLYDVNGNKVGTVKITERKGNNR